jgi:hypothetical protein
MDNRLLLEDIEDLRTYERGRDSYRRRIIELKRRRRVGVGPFVTFVFENRETVRFQIQEMARAERMMSDEQVQGELDIYNALLPSPMRPLSANGYRSSSASNGRSNSGSALPAPTPVPARTPTSLRRDRRRPTKRRSPDRP